MSVKQVTVGALLSVVGFAAGWTIRGGPKPGTKASNPPTPSESNRWSELDPSRQLSQTEHGVTRRAPASEPPDAEPVVTVGALSDPTMSEALAALDRAISLRPIYEDQDAAFAAKYEGASSIALREALNLVRTRVEA